MGGLHFLFKYHPHSLKVEKMIATAAAQHKQEVMVTQCSTLACKIGALPWKEERKGTIHSFKCNRTMRLRNSGKATR